MFYTVFIFIIGVTCEQEFQLPSMRNTIIPGMKSLTVHFYNNIQKTPLNVEPTDLKRYFLGWLWSMRRGNEM